MEQGTEMLFALFGGLAMFLYGMDRMSRALQRAAGDAMKRLLARLTATPLLGVLTGLAVTAVLQSSSAATVMVIGFVSAGLLELPRAVAVIYGINIGTTMTAQLIAFDVQTLVYPVLFLGFLLDFAARRPRWQAVGEAVFSFGLLFEGIDILGRALQPLAGQAVFLIIYFFCMLAGHAYKIGPRKFALLAGETLLGCAMGCVLLLPAGLSLLQNPRTIDPFNGMGYLVYGKAQQYGAIFYSAFLMPDAPYFKDMFSEGILKHTSMTAYLPVVGIAGGLAFCRGRRSHPFTYILKVCVVCAFVPILNSLFYALNSSYYARWYYMPVLVLCGATASLLARPHLARRELPRAWGLTLAVTLSAAAFGLVPYTDDDGVTTLGVTEEPARFWAILGVSVLGLVIFGVLWHFFRDRQRWPTVLLAAVLVFSFVYGSVHLSLTKYAQWDTDSDLIAETYDSVQEVKEALPDDAFYRIDAYGAHNNLGLWFDKSCLQFFNSTVAPSIMEFYPEVGVKRDVNSKPEVQNYAPVSYTRLTLPTN